MNKIRIKLADVVMEINTLREDLDDVCKDYLTDEEASVFIDHLDDDSIQELYHLIANALLEYNANVFHGAVVAKDNCAYMFIAYPGVGKTTHVKLWTEVFKDAVIINGDQPILKHADGVTYVCGSPFAGKEGLQKNISVPLKAIIELRRSDTNTINKISKDGMFDELLIRSMKCENDLKTIKLIGLIKNILDSVNFYELKCNMDKEAVLVAYETLNK